MIPNHIKINFQTMLNAADNGELKLLECTDSTTNEPRYVITAISWDNDTQEYVMTPFGHISTGNPYEEYNPPE